ncbi:hypothetical protein QAD02_022567 [Eretmocerus hayati]|uniref:Uncharacterized protein n=1 Tax=Eretmocerus hayati TaxID=131215 RepID=A0ACC2PUY7_9HYME|nr:hypothetical protein QAD02_022567 [Eretmocerus hayati]
MVQEDAIRHSLHHGESTQSAHQGRSAGGAAALFRSVTIFLASGRRAASSSLSKRHSLGTAVLQQQQSMRHARRRSAPSHTRKLDALAKRTNFSRCELDSLAKIYSKLTSIPGTRMNSSLTSNGVSHPAQTVEGIDRTIFREVLHNTFDILTEDALIERMFSCWDKHSEGAIRLESWILGLDVFLRGSSHEKMEFCFKIYDLNNDGFITKDEIFLLFKNCLMKQPGEEDPEEGVKDLTEMALKKFDLDHDGKISFSDYELTVQREPLLLEAFGQVLPTSERVAAFLLTLKS